MPRPGHAAAAIVALLLSACAAGAGMQGITVSTTPSGAACTLTRDGAALARIAATPATLAIPQGKSPLTVTCAHPPAHKSATVTLAPHYIGGAFDKVFGTAGPADYAYPAETHLDLPPGPPDLAPNPPLPVTVAPLPR